jgi:hypothetical protein
VKKKQITSKASKRPLSSKELADAKKSLIRSFGSGPRAQSEVHRELAALQSLEPRDARKRIAANSSD